MRNLPPLAADNWVILAAYRRHEERRAQEVRGWVCCAFKVF